MSIQSNVNTIIGAYASPKILSKVGKNIIQESAVDKAKKALDTAEKYSKSQNIPKTKEYANAIDEFVNYQMNEVAKYGLESGDFKAFMTAKDFLNTKQVSTKAQKSALKKRHKQLGGL